MTALGGVTVLALVLVVPSLTWLLWLTHRGTLADTEPESRPRAATEPGRD